MVKDRQSCKLNFYEDFSRQDFPNKRHKTQEEEREPQNRELWENLKDVNVLVIGIPKYRGVDIMVKE